MRQHSFLKFLAQWTGGFRVASAAGRARSHAPAGPQFVFPSMAASRMSAEQLDRLCGLVAPGLGDAPHDRSPRWDDRDPASARCQERFLRAVDRAIAEIATPRGRRGRARW